ncbi:hypothetical protein BSNK01_02600 [Bacillaceae bacterium]
MDEFFRRRRNSKLILYLMTGAILLAVLFLIAGIWYTVIF